MTQYFYDDERHELVATWSTGVGGRARSVAKLNASANMSAALALAERLTSLSAAAWRTYTHGGGFVEPNETNTEAWRLGLDRESFADIAETIANPDPYSRAYSSLVGSAEDVGHILSKMDDPGLTEAVQAEVADEIAAVSAAELGDLNGRAAQAVALTRAAPSPTQVQAAWDLLSADLLGSGSRLRKTLDPTSAAVAATAWLVGAAKLANTTSTRGQHWSRIVYEADDIEALPVATPSAVLKRHADGEAPSLIVQDLVTEARRVSEGLMPAPESMPDRIADAYALASQHPDAREAILAETRLSLLDPQRPGPDLLEDLLLAIRGCYLIWCESELDAEVSEADDDLSVDLDDLDDGVELDEEQWAAEEDSRRSRFAESVREHMATFDHRSL